MTPLRLFHEVLHFPQRNCHEIPLYNYSLASVPVHFMHQLLHQLLRTKVIQLIQLSSELESQNFIQNSIQNRNTYYTFHLQLKILLYKKCQTLLQIRKFSCKIQFFYKIVIQNAKLYFKMSNFTHIIFIQIPKFSLKMLDFQAKLSCEMQNFHTKCKFFMQYSKFHEILSNFT